MKKLNLGLILWALLSPLMALGYLSPIYTIDPNTVISISGGGVADCVPRWTTTGGFVLDNSDFCVDDFGNGTGLSSLAIGGALDASSIFDVISTTNGSRPCPAMTTIQRDAIGTPATGLCIYNLDDNEFQQYNSLAWAGMGGGGMDKWLTATDYKVDDVIWFNGNNKIYVALIDHTAGTFLTDLGNGDWQELSAVDFTGNVIGVNAMANGGTGKALTAAAGSIPWVDADSFELLAPTTAGRALLSGGAATPTWFNPTQYTFIVGGASGALGTLGPLTNGQLFIGSTGASAVAATLTATANQTTVSTGPGTLTFGTVQDIGTGSSPTFAGLTLTGFSGFLKATAGVISTALVDLSSNVSGVLGLANGGTAKNLTAVAGAPVYTDGDSMEVGTAGVAGQALISGGTGAPTWFAPTATRCAFYGTSGVLAQDAGCVYDSTNDILTIAGNLVIDGSAMYIGDGAGTSDTFVGSLAGTASASGGDRNTGIGRQALTALTTGDDNTAVGYQSLLSVIGSGANTAVGSNSGRAIVTGAGNAILGFDAYQAGTGSNNTAFGRGSMFNSTSADSNVALGYQSLVSNVTGDQNVAIGYEAGFAALGQGNVFIGYQAGAAETGSNTLYIDNSNTATPLIKGDFSADTLTITGTETINGQWNIDNLRADGNTISSTNSNGNVTVDPNGTGYLDVVGSIVSSALTNGRCLFAGALGIITDDAGCTYDTATDTLTVGNIEISSTTLATRNMGNIPYASRPSASSNTDKCYMDTTFHTMFCSDGVNWNIQGVQSNSTNWESYTPTLTNFTASSIECQKRYEGPDQLIRCKMTNTSTSAGEARISLADGATSADTATIASIQKAGDWFLGSTSTAHGGTILIEPSVGYVTVGSDQAFGNGNVNALSKQNASTIWGNNPWNFTARVPVLGRSASFSNYSVIGTGTVFSARVSSGGTVSNENVDFISGNCGLSTSTFTCTFVTSFFTSAPNCTLTGVGSTDAFGAITTQATTTGFTVITSTANSGAGVAYAYNITCQKTGTDFTLASQITATFKDVPTFPNSSNGAPKSYIATVDCDSGATITNETYTGTPTIGNIASGACTITIPGGNFTDANYIACNMSHTESGTGRMFQFTYTSTTSIDVHCDEDDDTNCADFDGRMTCTQY